MGNSSFRTGRLVLFALSGILVGLAIWFFVFRDQEVPVLSDADCELLSKLQNDVIAHLENEQPDKAFAALDQLEAQFPEELFVHQNRAIAAMQAYNRADKNKEEEVDQAIEGLNSALERLIARFPNALVIHLFAGKVAYDENDLPTALENYQKAHQLNPEDPLALYGIFLCLKPDGREKYPEEALNSIKKAQSLAPDNLALLRECLVATGFNGDDDFPDYFKQLEPAIKNGIDDLKVSGLDYSKQYEAVRASIESGKWKEDKNLSISLSQLNNILTGKFLSFKYDLALLLKAPVEFLVPEIPQLQCKPRFSELQYLTTEFSESGIQLPVLEGVRDVYLDDYNIDNLWDLWVLRDGRLEIYSRAGVGKPWSLLTGIDVPAGQKRIFVADLDNDETERLDNSAKPPVPAPVGPHSLTGEPCIDPDPDAVLWGDSGITLIHNRVIEGKNRELRLLAPLEFEKPIGKVLDLSVVDFNHDGDLDFVAATENGVRVLGNFGAFRFSDLTSRSRIDPEGKVESLFFVDWDRDLYFDVLCTGATLPFGQLQNKTHGRLGYEPAKKDWEQIKGLSQVTSHDWDDNGSWDVIGLQGDKVVLATTSTPEPGRVLLKEFAELASGYQSLDVADFNNDGQLDLLLTSKNKVAIGLVRPEDKTKIELVELPNPPKGIIRADWGDVDHDRDLDVLVASTEGVKIYDNLKGQENRALTLSIKIRNTTLGRGRFNPNGIGTYSETRFGSRTQSRVVRRRYCHIGLSQHEKPDTLRVVYTNGIPQQTLPEQIKTETYHCDIEVLKTSCPYLYTWDGEKFVFVTDLLWNAPLGLQFEEGVIAPDRPWEFLKIDGARLRPKEGKYLLQVTEELWEATYFDQIELIAVDHPDDVDIYTNEKVGPAEIAEPKIHTVRNPLPPMEAKDHTGKELLHLVIAEDGEFTPGYGKQYRQGLGEEHFLELKLPELEDPKKITMFLTGWMYPGDTSINVGDAESQLLPTPKPPALYVPDAQGNWQEVRPFMGFPGGKTKTIAVDLSDLFISEDRRLRIVTNFDLHWDQVFFSVDESPSPVETTNLKLSRADLHYRGRSRQYWDGSWGPDRFDYDRTITDPLWPPMRGKFTRFGDVLPLLQKIDDKFLVMGSGDEVTLEFDLPEKPLKKGWERDFIIHNFGWEKDADLNTVLGQDVEPLPFQKMSKYPYPADEEYPSDDTHQQYLKEYQTREQSPAKFWRKTQRGE